MSSIARAVLGIIALGGAFVPSAAAQKGTQLTAGVMAGVNYGKASSDPKSTEFTFEYKTGWLVGAFLGIKVNDMFSVEPQAFYSVKGSEFKGIGSASSLTASVKAGYLEVPLLGKLWFPTSNSQITPYVFAGPVFEYKLTCTADGAIVSGSGSQDCDKTDINLKSTSFAATGGAGLEFKAGAQVVRVDGRYTYGLTNINKTSANDNTKVKLRTFAVTAGVGFPLPR